MDKQDLRTLQLLEEIEKNHISSQRELARKMNVSLGLTNSFIKRLSHKGYFKITAIPKNRIKYMLTPMGFAEKTRLTYEYIQYSYKFYKSARQKLRKLFKGFMEEDVHDIVFYGAGDFAEIAYVSLQETSIDLVAVVDDHKVGRNFIKKKITHPDLLNSLSFDRILITIVQSQEKIIKSIIDKGIPSYKVVYLE